MGYGWGRAIGRVVAEETPRYEEAEGSEGSDGAAAGSDESLAPDELEALGDEIATMAAHVHAGEHAMLIRLARFDRHGGWELAGHRSCAHWLSFRTGFDLGTAREHVRVARALVSLPETSEAMARGALSFSKVRALTRIAKPETEADLVVLAEGGTAAQLEYMVRAWKKHMRLEEADLERERLRSRKLSAFSDEGGMIVLQALLPAEGGALFMRAIDEASDEIYRAERASGEALREASGEMPTEAAAARRRADALVLVVERALAVGFEGAKTKARGSDSSSDPEAEADSAGAAISGTRAERYQVMLHVDPGTLAEDGEPGRSHLGDGTRVSAETSRRLACDAGLVRVQYDEGGALLSVGRRSRTIPPALRRALEVRDRGCRFPGCGLRFTEAHHVVHWADGGETSLKNTVLLCRHHHRLVHEYGWKLECWARGRVAFLDPRGQAHVGGERMKSPALQERPAEALVERNHANGVLPDARTASACWQRERDIPDAVLFRAIEAGLS